MRFRQMFGLKPSAISARSDTIRSHFAARGQVNAVGMFFSAAFSIGFKSDLKLNYLLPGHVTHFNIAR